MTFNGRIVALERQVASRVVVLPQADPERRAREVFLARVPEDLRAAVESLLDTPDSQRSEALARWVGSPFARWAPEPVADFCFPRSLVEWVLDPPRRFWMGHHCGHCGLAVPLYLTRSNDPDPPSDPRPFLFCPSCGGATSHTAYYQPDSVMEGIP